MCSHMLVVELWLWVQAVCIGDVGGGWEVAACLVRRSVKRQFVTMLLVCTLCDAAGASGDEYTARSGHVSHKHQLEPLYTCIIHQPTPQFNFDLG